MHFKDHFSTQAADYAKYRPTYPDKLFDYLASLVPDKHKAWDCATGNGQAALALANHFDFVIATDASEKQIKNAIQHEKIKYVVTEAEQTDIESHSCDLITVAQAVHWFDFDKFFKECKRVLKPQGIVAVWCYNLLAVEFEIDCILADFYYNTVGPYWPPERKWIEDNYKSLPFPFEEIQAQNFEMKANWNLYDLIGYLNTWSATQKFITQNGINPVKKIEDKLSQAWGAQENKKLIKWPINLRIGRA